MGKFFEHCTKVELSCGPSFHYNNLALCGNKTALAVKPGVLLGQLDSSYCKKLPLRGDAIVIQVVWLEEDGFQYLVVATTEGLKVWDVENMNMIYQFVLHEELDEATEGGSHYCSGVSVSGNMVLVGTSFGKVLVLKMVKRNIVLVQTLDKHKAPVHASAMSCSVAATGDADGSLVLLDVKDNFQMIQRVNDDCAITSVLLTDDFAVVGNVSGTIQWYRKDSGTIAYRVHGHARGITGLAQYRNLICSVAEDTYLNVWKIPDMDSKSSTDIALEFSTCVEQSYLTGVAIKNNGDIVVSAYDKHNLFVFPIEQK